MQLSDDRKRIETRWSRRKVRGRPVRIVPLVGLALLLIAAIALTVVAFRSQDTGPEPLPPKPVRSAVTPEPSAAGAPPSESDRPLVAAGQRTIAITGSGAVAGAGDTVSAWAGDAFARSIDVGSSWA